MFTEWPIWLVVILSGTVNQLFKLTVYSITKRHLDLAVVALVGLALAATLSLAACGSSGTNSGGDATLDPNQPVSSDDPTPTPPPTPDPIVLASPGTAPDCDMELSASSAIQMTSSSAPASHSRHIAPPVGQQPKERPTPLTRPF